MRAAFSHSQGLPQNCHSEECRRPTKNPFTPQQVNPSVKRPLATLGVTGGVIHAGMREAVKITFEGRPVAGEGTIPNP